MALNIILPVVLLGAALVGLLCIIRGCRSRTGAWRQLCPGVHAGCVGVSVCRVSAF